MDSKAPGGSSYALAHRPPTNKGQKLKRRPPPLPKGKACTSCYERRVRCSGNVICDACLRSAKFLNRTPQLCTYKPYVRRRASTDSSSSTGSSSSLSSEHAGSSSSEPAPENSPLEGVEQEGNDHHQTASPPPNDPFQLPSSLSVYPAYAVEWNPLSDYDFMRWLNQDAMDLTTNLSPPLIEGQMPNFNLPLLPEIESSRFTSRAMGMDYLQTGMSDTMGVRVETGITGWGGWFGNGPEDCWHGEAAVAESPSLAGWDWGSNCH